MNQTVTFQSLLGDHMLKGVAMMTEPVTNPAPFDDPTRNGIAFNLDGIAYICWEDPNDGYRSSMGALEVVGVDQIRVLFAVAAQFGKGIPVTMAMMPDEDGPFGTNNDVMEFTDRRNGKVILRVGTTNTSDYYPSSVMNWHPEDVAS